jgi:hypothetical protein
MSSDGVNRFPLPPCLANWFSHSLVGLRWGSMRSKCTIFFILFVEVGARQPALRLAVHGVRGAGRGRARNQGSALRLVPADASHRLPKGGSGALFRYWYLRYSFQFIKFVSGPRFLMNPESKTQRKLEKFAVMQYPIFLLIMVPNSDPLGSFNAYCRPS